MNLYFRLLWLLITSRFRGRLAPPLGVSRLSFRVWPTDLDTNLHMNNGRYLTLADLGRTDLMVRTSLWRLVLKKGWMPVLSGSIIRYRRELRAFRRFSLESRILCWNDRNFVMEHRFIADHEGQPHVAAIALVRGGIYERRHRRFVPPGQIFAAIGHSGQSPAQDAAITAFMAAEDGLRSRAGSAPAIENPPE